MLSSRNDRVGIAAATAVLPGAAMRCSMVAEPYDDPTDGIGGTGMRTLP